MVLPTTDCPSRGICGIESSTHIHIPAILAAHEIQEAQTRVKNADGSLKSMLPYHSGGHV